MGKLGSMSGERKPWHRLLRLFELAHLAEWLGSKVVLYGGLVIATGAALWGAFRDNIFLALLAVVFVIIFTGLITYRLRHRIASWLERTGNKNPNENAAEEEARELRGSSFEARHSWERFHAAASAFVATYEAETRPQNWRERLRARWEETMATANRLERGDREEAIRRAGNFKGLVDGTNPDGDFGLTAAQLKNFLFNTKMFYRQLEKEARALGRRRPPSPTKDRAVLSVEPKVDSLGYAYPQEWPGAMLEAGFRKREFALLTVRNVGEKNAREVVAECKLSSTGAVLNCHWSREANGKFALGGSCAEDLNVWQSRVLLIAQAFGTQKLWARLPADQKHIFHPSAFGDDSDAVRLGDAAWARSPAGESLDIDRKVELIVSFHAEGVNHSERVLLSFGSEGPNIDLLPEESHPGG